MAGSSPVAGTRKLVSRLVSSGVREEVKGSGFLHAMRRAVDASFPGSDFGTLLMLPTLVRLILLRGRRVLQLERDEGDPMMARFAGREVLRWPSTVSYWLQTLRN